MKKFFKAVSMFFSVILLVSAFTDVKVLAYSERPDYFDFGDSVVSIDAGATKEVWIKTQYNYTYFVGPHTSTKTYVECSGRGGSEYMKIHIGPDETTKNVFFYFYIDDEKVANADIHDFIEVYVQNIDPAAVDAYNAQNAAMDSLKNYAGNNAEFNAYYYYTNYKDLQDAFGADADKLLNHYNQLGKAEGRVANRIK
ncbi:MAG: hypothetical protein E7301_05820 [Butyrivibrio sp.]|nr:hypothetical protein [Butyrivibrio sp.]